MPIPPVLFSSMEQLTSEGQVDQQRSGGHLTVDGARTNGSDDFRDPGIKGRKGGRASSGKIAGKSIFKVSSFCPYKEASVQGLR